MNYVLRPLSLQELENFIDNNSLKILDYFMKKSLFSQPEKRIGQRNLPIQIPKEHIEQRFVQALGVEGIGAGSYAIDLINYQEGWGADVKMLTAKTDKQGNLLNSDSGETSLAQKFIDTGSNLDTLFHQRDFQAIKDEWLTIYKHKLEEVKSIKKIKDIYYFILLRGGNNLYLVGMEVQLNYLHNTSVNIHKTDKPRTKSVFIDGLIDPLLGNTKVYKSKKRLELRLRPKSWLEQGLCMIFPLPQNDIEINFLETLNGNPNFNIENYALEKATILFKQSS